MSTPIQALVVTKGHPFEREPFFQALDAMRKPDPQTVIKWTHVEHPAAEAVLTPDGAAAFDVIVFYDMPGVVFTHGDPPFAVYDPSDRFKKNFLALLDAGKPMVFMHHAIASWPTWPEFAEIVGGRFHFLPGELRGQSYPGSGYRFRAEQTISVVDPTHPIVEGFADAFPIRDEVYLYTVFENDVTPLLRSDFAFKAENFRYGGVDFKNHPEGSNLVGWTKKARNASIAYLQFGHDHVAYADPHYRRLVANAVKWAAAENPSAGTQITTS